MGAAEVISFEEVRARKQWSTLRQQLHARFDQWLDTLEQQRHEPPSTLMEVTSTVWDLRQQLTGDLTETIVAHVHRGKHDRQKVPCPTCDRVLQAREPVCRTVETMVGSVQLERPYFYCRACRCGMYPLDEVLGLSAGQLQLDVHQAAARLFPLAGGGIQGTKAQVTVMRKEAGPTPPFSYSGFASPSERPQGRGWSGRDI
jgi:hypothetical protein